MGGVKSLSGVKSRWGKVIGGVKSRWGKVMGGVKSRWGIIGWGKIKGGVKPRWGIIGWGIVGGTTPEILLTSSLCGWLGGGGVVCKVIFMSNPT